MLDFGQLKRQLLAILMIEFGVVVGEQLIEIGVAPMRSVPQGAGRKLRNNRLCDRAARGPIGLSHWHHEPGLIVARTVVLIRRHDVQRHVDPYRLAVFPDGDGILRHLEILAGGQRDVDAANARFGEQGLGLGMILCSLRDIRIGEFRIHVDRREAVVVGNRRTPLNNDFTSAARSIQ